MRTKEEFYFAAKIAQGAERYEDMAYSMKSAVRIDGVLDLEGKDLLAAGYKLRIATRRRVWDVINGIEGKVFNPGAKQIVLDYKLKVRYEVEDICVELLRLLDLYLIPKINNAFCGAFYMKLKGDYYRYLAEFSTGEPRKRMSAKALKAYQEATALTAIMRPTHPYRLGLALNFSVFYYDILNSPDGARRLAQEAYDNCMEEFKVGQGYPNSEMIVALLKNNLDKWREMKEKEESAEELTGIAAVAAAAAAAAEAASAAMAAKNA